MAFKKIVQIVGISFMMALTNVFGGTTSSNEYLFRLTKNITSNV